MLKNSFIVILILVCFSNWKKTEKASSLKYISNNEILYIKIFSQLKVQSFTFSSETGSYLIFANGVEILNTTKFPLIKFSYSNDSIEVKTFENVIGK